MTIYRYEPVRNLANSSIGDIIFEVKGWKEPRIEEAKQELIKILSPKLKELKQDPEKNKHSIDFINQTINRFPTSWKVTMVKETKNQSYEGLFEREEGLNLA